jgi:predicted nuclease of predicted toxin-antitoxin system
MKFLLDAMLPRRVARRLFSEMTAIEQWLREPGFVELTRHGLVVHDA